MNAPGYFIAGICQLFPPFSQTMTYFVRKLLDHNLQTLNQCLGKFGKAIKIFCRTYNFYHLKKNVLKNCELN